MAAEDEGAQGFAVVFLQDVAHGEEVAERFAHFFVVNLHEAVVYPVIDVRMAAGAFALRDFAFVVREFEIHAATVDVEVFAEGLCAHHRAFDVPAGAAFAPGAVPRRFAGFCRFPQDEVERVFFRFVHRDALTGAQIIKAAVGEFAVGGEAAHGVVNVAVIRGIGVTFGDEGLHEFNHAGNGSGGARLDIRTLATERRFVFVHGVNEARGEGVNRLAIFMGTGDDFVVDVGDVAHVFERVTARAQVAGDGVKDDHHPRVADVAVVIDGHAADVHADFAGRNRGEGFFLPGQAVVKLQCVHESLRGNFASIAAP